MTSGLLSGFGIEGALVVLFEILHGVASLSFHFVRFAIELIIALSGLVQIVESFSGPQEIVALLGIWRRPPRKPPDKLVAYGLPPSLNVRVDC